MSAIFICSLYCFNLFLYTFQLGLIIRAVSIGHPPPTNFILVTMGSTAVLLIGWRALFFSIFPSDKGKKNDVYKRGSPFELFETSQRGT
ncbi:transmembrane protein [Perilla frutescens var. hirtella]|uniref:Transmembrane protein n=1 Tax=Perilla frutescens var. hirtella TaxID=608512 RepID=A0AAD4NXP1_PERFH|nr:transmembrane protein [Perilla frutescens var. hirtella]KAH6776349.1 transmembrane protein [Perilla frutescens var. hirtella]